MTLEFSRDFHLVLWLQGELNEKLLIKEIKYKQRGKCKDRKPAERKCIRSSASFVEFIFYLVTLE